MFAVKLAIFLCLLFPKKLLLSVWRVLKTSSAIIGPLRYSSEIFDNLRESSVVIEKSTETWSCREMAEIGLFGAVFASFWKKFTLSKNFLLFVLKCLKFKTFNCFMLRSQKMKCLVLSSYPLSEPLLSLHVFS